MVYTWELDPFTVKGAPYGYFFGITGLGNARLRWDDVKRCYVVSANIAGTVYLPPKDKMYQSDLETAKHMAVEFAYSKLSDLFFAAQRNIAKHLEESSNDARHSDG